MIPKISCTCLMTPLFPSGCWWPGCNPWGHGAADHLHCQGWHQGALPKNIFFFSCGEWSRVKTTTLKKTRKNGVSKGEVALQTPNFRPHRQKTLGIVCVYEIDVLLFWCFCVPELEALPNKLMMLGTVVNKPTILFQISFHVLLMVAVERQLYLSLFYHLHLVWVTTVNSILFVMHNAGFDWYRRNHTRTMASCVNPHPKFLLCSIAFLIGARLFTYSQDARMTCWKMAGIFPDMFQEM